MAKKMQSGKFDLNDLADQLRQMEKLGGMGGIMGMMPGMGKMKDQMAAAGLDDRMFKQQLAIIGSMTRAERANPDMLKHSRKQRIAKGSGTDAAAINKLLKMHRQMADMMKAMGGKGKGGGMMRAAMGGLASKMGLGGMMPGGMGGLGGMPDLSKMDPKQLEALQKQAEAAGLTRGMPGGLPGLPGGGMKLPGLPGGGLPGLPKGGKR
jgi:signal recognition particle subunit SRP54